VMRARRIHEWYNRNDRSDTDVIGRAPRTLTAQKLSCHLDLPPVDEISFEAGPAARAKRVFVAGTQTFLMGITISMR
jgi:hypothetical protein